MGRTVAAYSWQLEKVRDRFRKFRASLRREDQHLFDDLMLYAKLHVQAGVMAAFPNPSDPVMLSMLIEQQRQLSRMKRELQRLKDSLKSSEGNPPGSSEVSAEGNSVEASSPEDVTDV